MAGALVDRLRVHGDSISAAGTGPASSTAAMLCEPPPAGLIEMTVDVDVAVAGGRTAWRLQAGRERKAATPVAESPVPVDDVARASGGDPYLRLVQRRQEVAGLRDQVHALMTIGFGAQVSRPAIARLEPAALEERIARLSAALGVTVAVQHRGREPAAGRQTADAWAVDGRAPAAAFAAWTRALADLPGIVGLEEVDAEAEPGGDLGFRGRLLCYVT